MVADPRKETMSREVYRHAEFEGMVDLTRIRDYFLCELSLSLYTLRSAQYDPSALVSIETTGQYPPQDLFPESIRIMRSKIQTLKLAAEMLRTPPEDDAMEA